MTLFSNNNIKFNNLTIPYTSNSFSWVVARNSCLVDKNIFLGVISVDETVSTLHVKPFDHARHFGSDDLLLRGSLGLIGLIFRVGHDVLIGEDGKYGPTLLDVSTPFLLVSSA